MGTLRSALPVFARPGNIFMLLFLGGWSLLLPFLFASLSSGDESIQVLQPLLAREGSEAYLRALWHLGILFPLAVAGCVRFARLDNVERASLWIVPAFRARYFRFEIWIASGVSLFVGAVHLWMQGPAKAFAAFALSLLVFLLLDPIRWRNSMELPATAARVAILIALLRPSWAIVLLEWQPLVLALLMLAFVSVLYDSTGLDTWARGHTEEKLTPEDMHRRSWNPSSDVMTAVENFEASEWRVSLWLAPTRDWLRAAWYETWTGRIPRFVLIFVFFYWVANGLLPGRPQMFLAFLGLRTLATFLKLPSRYPLERSRRASIHFLSSALCMSIVLPLIASGFILASPIRALWNEPAAPLFDSKGLLVWLGTFLALAPIALWPYKWRDKLPNHLGTSALVPHDFIPLAAATLVDIAFLILLRANRDSLPPLAPVAVATTLAISAQLLYWLLLRRHYARGDLI